MSPSPSSCCSPCSRRPRPPRRLRRSPGTRARADTRSTYGSGAFGTWATDAAGLPAYRYTLDQARSAFAPQAELAGSRDAWHQLGNDRTIATAHNDGFVQLWSQDRIYEWLNRADPANGHYAGGYGYLRLDGTTYSTLYADRAPGVKTERLFGTGYFGRRTEIPGTATVAEKVYAPFGDDPVLLHDVTITNTSPTRRTASWFEYWDVNPQSPLGRRRATAAPSLRRARPKTLSVAQLPDAGDLDPLSVFAASLSGPVAGVVADGGAFFGAGGRAKPDAVAADRLTGAVAPPSQDGVPGTAMFAFRAPVSLAPGQSVTLRYAYGYGHPPQIAPLVAKWRAAADPFAASRRAWARFVPQASFGSKKWAWLSRELQWDAYTLRSGTSYEECAGRHIVSQGGYYQYGLDFQGAFRDPLQHVLPLIYAAPQIAREVLLYSAAEQPKAGARPLLAPGELHPVRPARDIRRPRHLAAVDRRRVRPGHARHLVLRPARPVGRRGQRDGLGAPQALRRRPGVAARPQRAVPRGDDRRLVGPADPRRRHDGVHASSPRRPPTCTRASRSSPSCAATRRSRSACATSAPGCARRSPSSGRRAAGTRAASRARRRSSAPG